MSSFLVSVIYRRKCSLESDDKEIINQSIFDNQHVDGSAENNEVEMLTSPMGKNMNITYQGLKTQTPTLVGKNNKIPHQGMDAKPKHNWMNKVKKIYLSKNWHSYLQSMIHEIEIHEK